MFSVSYSIRDDGCELVLYNCRHIRKLTLRATRSGLFLAFEASRTVIDPVDTLIRAILLKCSPTETRTLFHISAYMEGESRE